MNQQDLIIAAMARGFEVTLWRIERLEEAIKQAVAALKDEDPDAAGAILEEEMDSWD